MVCGVEGHAAKCETAGGAWEPRGARTTSAVSDGIAPRARVRVLAELRLMARTGRRAALTAEGPLVGIKPDRTANYITVNL